MLGKKRPAAAALDWGLINRVVPDEEVDAAGLELARQLAQGPRSLGIIQQIAWSVLDASFETALSNERVAQRDAGRTEDFIEGVAAFGKSARRCSRASNGRGVARGACGGTPAVSPSARRQFRVVISPRAITCAWISAAPSKMLRMRASHSTRLISYSSA